MGCDIHLKFEKKNSEGKWEALEVDERLIPDERNYELFSFLADVRSYEPFKQDPQFPRRGIPEDSCFKSLFKDPDIHSPTHAYLDEILRAPWDKAKLQDDYFYTFCRYVLPKLSKTHSYMTMTTEDQRNIRILIGFDN